MSSWIPILRHCAPRPFFGKKCCDFFNKIVVSNAKKFETTFFRSEITPHPPSNFVLSRNSSLLEKTGFPYIMVIFCSCYSPCPISLQTAVIDLWWWSIRHKWHLLKRGLFGLTFIEPWLMSYWVLEDVLHNIYRPIWGIASAALLKDLIVLLNSQMFCLRNRNILSKVLLYHKEVSFLA